VITRRLIAGALLLACTFAAPHQASAQSSTQIWPTRQPIRLIVPFPAGSAIDTIARPIFEQVSKQIGQSFVFENRPGAGGTLGMGIAARADADGYTLLVNSSVHTIVPTTYTKLPFDTVRDFAGIVPLGQFPNVLVAPPGRFKNVQDLVAKAKEKPGSLNYGSGGVGAATHLNAERFRLSAGFEVTHIPFKGAPEALREVLGGRLDFYFAPLLTAVPLIQAKQLDGLAVSSLQRDDALPDVPTTREAGYPDSEYIFWIGAFAPAGVPKDIVTRLHDEIVKALAEPSVRDVVKKLGANPMPLTPAAYDAFIKTEIESNARLIKAAGITPN
jgi:tripartite-type tricarboxylate transporter receptor subunit TctC